MKYIQELITEMEKLNAQVAATTDETEQELAGLVTAAQTVSDPPLGTACCLVNVPNEFTLPNVVGGDDFSFPTANTRVIISTVNLRTCVSKISLNCTSDVCPNVPIPTTAYQVKIFGCIPYIANLFPITVPAGSSCIVGNGDPAVCCSGKFCVDKTIAVFATESEANTFLTNNPKLLTCDNIGATLRVTLVAPRPAVGSTPAVPAICSDSKTIKFEVAFRSVAGTCQ